MMTSGVHLTADRRIPAKWRCSRHGAPTVAGCTSCTAIVRSLIDVVGLRRCRSAQNHQLAAELVIRFAANATPNVRTTRAVSLAARLYVVTVPEPHAPTPLVDAAIAMLTNERPQ